MIFRHGQTHFALWPILIICVTLLSGCGNREARFGAGDSQQAIYAEARRLLEKNRFDLAILQLEALEKEFPFGPYAEQAQLELIYAHYRAYDFAEAIARAKRFVSLQPDHPQLDYTYYLMGLSTFSASQGLLKRFFDVDLSSRDLGAATDALVIFRELLQRFPESQYSGEVRQRMKHLRNLLARKELTVANHYLHEEVWLAAANRGRYVVTNYEGTPAVADALAVMVYSYRQLGLHDLANDSLRVLRTNYPDYPLLGKNADLPKPGRGKSGWLAKLTLGAVKGNRSFFDTRRAPPPEVK